MVARGAGPRLSRARGGRGGTRGQAVDLVALLAAEAARQLGLRLAFRLTVLGHHDHRDERAAGHRAGADHVPGLGDAGIADVYVGARDQLLDLGLVLTAERAGQFRSRTARLALTRLALSWLALAEPAAGAAGRLDDLVDPLVAEAEGAGQLAERGAAAGAGGGRRGGIRRGTPRRRARRRSAAPRPAGLRRAAPHPSVYCN